MDRWIPEFKKYTSRVPVILIGTQPESEEEKSSDLHDKQIGSYKEALSVQNIINGKGNIPCAKFFECLLASGEQFIEEVIAEAVKAAWIHGPKVQRNALSLEEIYCTLLDFNYILAQFY